MALSLAATATVKCPEGSYDCHQDGKKCLPFAVVCNGKNDCGNNEDETDASCAGEFTISVLSDVNFITSLTLSVLMAK